ncbi:unnamed protein product [Gadus morhua 'NCC']
MMCGKPPLPAVLSHHDAPALQCNLWPGRDAATGLASQPIGPDTHSPGPAAVITQPQEETGPQLHTGLYFPPRPNKALPSPGGRERTPGPAAAAPSVHHSVWEHQQKAVSPHHTPSRLPAGPPCPAATQAGSAPSITEGYRYG